jgi:AcrR family transcriptional regulator
METHNTPPSSPIMPGSSKERLAELGFEMAMADGLGALSARSLAERLHASPSTMNYNFGSREQFLAAVQKQAIARIKIWRHDANNIQAVAAPWTTFADTVLALIQDRLSRFRLLEVLLLEFAAEAELSPPLLEGAQAEAEADDRFWRTIAASAGGDEAAVWSDLSAGLRLIFVPEPDAKARALWIGGVLRRLTHRLERRRPTPIHWSELPDAAARLQAAKPPGETATKVIRAALQLIADKGVTRMSQRDVAAVAGVSLASVTYCYRTRADLVAAAFAALQGELRTAVLEKASTTPGTLSWSNQAFDDAGNFQWRVRALRELIIMSARDVSLLPIIGDIRRMRGATSISLLRQSGVPDADQLDAFLWSSLLRGIGERLRFVAPALRRSAFEAAIRSHLAKVFNVQIHLSSAQHVAGPHPQGGARKGIRSSGLFET